MSLSFKVRGPVSAVVKSLIVSPSMTWAEFCSLLKSELNINENIDVLYGFPVVAHSHPDDQLVGSVLSTNESIRVQLSTSAGQQAQGSSKAKPKKKATTKPATTSGASGVCVKVAGLKAESSQKSFLVNSPHKRTLAASSWSSQEHAVKRRRKSSSASKISSENDIADHLLSAVSGGTGTQNRVARKVFRNAVAHQYSSTQAVHRVNAIYSGKYTMRECGGQCLATSAGSNNFTHVEVAYNKGAGSRSQHVETVELLSKELLLGVLKVAVLGEDGQGRGSDDAREVLKPMNLSRCSPRIFWSLVFHYGPIITESIRTVLRGVDDCAWLDERKKELSEKARINQAQKDEQEAAKQARKAAKGKGKVEKAVPTGASPSGSSVTDIGTTATPTSGGASNIEATRTGTDDGFTAMLRREITEQSSLEDLVPEGWRGALLNYLQVPEDSSGDVVMNLAQLQCSLKLRDAISSMHSGAGSSSGGGSSLSLDQLESWIASAQAQVFHIVWRTICGGGSERLRCALHKLRIRVPKEFRVWRAAPEGLLQGLLDSDAELVDKISYTWAVERDDKSAEATQQPLDVERVSWMCEVSNAALRLFAWMHHDGLAQLVHEEEQEEVDGEVEEGGGGVTEEERVAQEVEEGWIHTATAHRYLGQRVRVTVGSGHYWEEGTVVAYLPPEEDEPMALWKVHVDASPADKKLGRRERCEDLEEHEIVDAMIV